MSREEVARAALRSLGTSGVGSEGESQGSMNEPLYSRSYIGPSYQRPLPALRRQSSAFVSTSRRSSRERALGNGDLDGDVRTMSRPTFARYDTPPHTLSGLSSPHADTSSSATNTATGPANASSAQQKSFFSANGSHNVPMTASPTTSPSLVPIRSPRYPESGFMSGTDRAFSIEGREGQSGQADREQSLHRPRPQRRGPAVSAARSGGTPVPFDMPSLCSSTSSGTDFFGTRRSSVWRDSERSSQPYTPVSETGPSTHGEHASPNNAYSLHRSPFHPSASASSSTSPRFTGMASREERRQIEAIRRVAIESRVAPEEIQRALESHKKQQKSDKDAMEGVDGADSAAPHGGANEQEKNAAQLVDAVHAEEARLVRLDAHRVANSQNERSHSDMLLETNPASHGTPFARYDLHSPRRTRDKFPPLYTHSRTMPPLSPPPPYEALDRAYFEGTSSSPSHVSGPWNGVPSARMALEALSNGSPAAHHVPSHTNDSQQQHFHTRYNDRSGGTSSFWPHANDHHGSMPRPLTLPDRSYRSMDDYGANLDAHNEPGLPAQISQAFAPGAGASPLHRGGHGAQGPKHMTRSPLVGSPRDLNGEGAEHEMRDDVSMNSDATKRSAESSIQREDLYSGPKRRATGGDILDLDGMRSSSPAPMPVASGNVRSIPVQRQQQNSGGKMLRTRNGRGKSSTVPIRPALLKLNHEEVMARLQRKVKERIAARSASGASTIKGGLGLFGGDDQESSSSFFASSNLVASPPTSPLRASSAMDTTLTTETPGSSTLSVGHRAPQKSKSLLVSPRSPTNTLSTSPSPSHRVDVSTPPFRMSPGRGSIVADTDASKSGFLPSPSRIEDDASSRLGIEALLSAAAIADSPRPL